MEVTISTVSGNRLLLELALFQSTGAVGVQYLAQGDLDMQPREPRRLTSDIPIYGKTYSTS